MSNNKLITEEFISNEDNSTIKNTLEESDIIKSEKIITSNNDIKSEKNNDDNAIFDINIKPDHIEEGFNIFKGKYEEIDNLDLKKEQISSEEEKISYDNTDEEEMKEMENIYNSDNYLKKILAEYIEDDFEFNEDDIKKETEDIKVECEEIMKRCQEFAPYLNNLKSKYDIIKNSTNQVKNLVEDIKLQINKIEKKIPEAQKEIEELKDKYACRK